MSIGVYDFQVNGAAPSKVGGLGTTAKYFPRLTGPSIGVAPLTPSSTSPVGALFIPGGNVFNGQLFKLHAAGTYGTDTGDPSGTVSVKLYVVTGTNASPTYTSIATIATTTPLVSTTHVWGLECTLLGGGGFLGGAYSPYVDGALGTTATTTTVISGLDFQNGNAGLGIGAVCGFVVGVTFGTTDATNSATLTQFLIS